MNHQHLSVMYPSSGFVHRCVGSNAIPTLKIATWLRARIHASTYQRHWCTSDSKTSCDATGTGGISGACRSMLPCRGNFHQDDSGIGMPQAAKVALKSVPAHVCDLKTSSSGVDGTDFLAVGRMESDLTGLMPPMAGPGLICPRRPSSSSEGGDATRMSAVMEGALRPEDCGQISASHASSEEFKVNWRRGGGRGGGLGAQSSNSLNQQSASSLPSGIVPSDAFCLRVLRSSVGASNVGSKGV